MKKLLMPVVVLSLTGCLSKVNITLDQMNKSVELCKSNDGLLYNEITPNAYKSYCKNGATFHTLKS